jgi:serine/threonine-protein kinase
MICPRCSVAEISADTNVCELCGYTLLGSHQVAVQARVADEVLETVQRELAGRFEINVMIRQDRGSSLYLARDTEDDRMVGLRLIPRQGPVDGELIHRFAQAATLAGQLRHPHLVPVRKHGVTTSLLWYSMDAVKSRTLNAVLQADGQLTLGRTLDLLEQIASGLEYLHRNGVVHGGIGRQSVLVDGEGWARVSDLGTATAIYRAAGPGVGWEALLDLPFAAPELIERRLMGPAADQFSLAAVAYTCLAGHTPFSATSVDDLRRERTAPVRPLTEARADIPAYVDTAVQRALRDEPTDRFGSVLDFVAVLGGAGARSQGLLLRPSGRPSAAQVVVVPAADDEVAPRPRPRKRQMLVAAGVVAIVAILAFIVSRSSGPRDPQWAEGTARTPPAAAPPAAASPPTVTPGPGAGAPDRPFMDEPVADPSAVAPPPPRPRATGTVILNSTPWGAVYVDGRLVGNTPQTNLQLSVGTHMVRIVRDGFMPWEREVQMRRGDTLRITDIVLEPIRP